MRTIVGVLRGGPSSEYDLSLKSGAEVLQALDKDKYDPRDIYIDKAGVWHERGFPMQPVRALQGVDVAINVLHEYGEDGRVHRILDSLNIPYTGAGAAASILALNRHHARSVIKPLGIKIPFGKVIEQTPDIHGTALELFRTFPHPAIIKPVVGGGMFYADNFYSLERALERAWQHSPRVLVEEYINGKRASVGVIDNFRGESAYTLLPAEGERVPGLFAQHEKKLLMDAARAIHQTLNLNHYSHSDFVVSKRGVYFVETSSGAGVSLVSEHPFSRALHAVGVKLSHFLDHVINLARGK